MIRFFLLTLLATSFAAAQFSDGSIYSSSPDLPTESNTNYKGILASIGGGVTIIGASGSEIDILERTINDELYPASKTATIGGTGSVRVGYQLGKTSSIYSGIDLGSKGYRLKLATEGNQSAYYEQKGLTLEIPLLYRPMIPAFFGGRRVILLAGLSPSFLLTDRISIYTDKTGLTKTSSRETIDEENSMDVTFELTDSLNNKTEQFTYDDFNRKLDLNLVFAVGSERVVTKHSGLFWVATIKKGMINSIRISEEAVEKLQTLNATTQPTEKKHYSISLALGYNYYH